ncbi:MAG: hypothetical protein DME98_04120 [Verrucomicrobia bacterium]|nr:MAG: hypothetical protein DME98_04120 [Verrucomicrobiota bacterium]
MSGWQQRNTDAMHGSFATEWQNVFDAMTRQPTLKQTCCRLGNDNLLVRRNMVAVRVRNKSEALCVPRIQPQVLFRQVNAALVTDFNHKSEFSFKFSLVP